MSQQKIELTLDEWAKLKMLALWGMCSGLSADDRTQFHDAHKMLCEKIPSLTIEHDAPKPPPEPAQVLPYMVMLRNKDGTSAHWQFFSRAKAHVIYVEAQGVANTAAVWIVDNGRITEVWQAKK